MFSESEIAEYSFGFAYDDEYGTGGRFDDYDSFDDETDFEDDEAEVSFDDLQDDEIDAIEDSFDDIEAEDGYSSFRYHENDYYDAEAEQFDFDDED